jgi:hypothetical protein
MYELTLNPFGLRYDDGLRTVKIVILTIRIGQIDVLIIAVHNTLDFNH